MVGRTISHYQILSQIGEGGMGVVYKAQDTKLNRPVALKFLSAQYVNEADKARFLREAQAAALLNHPNICPIFDIDEVDGQIFFAMAFLEGRTLSKIVASERMELDRAVSIAMQIAAGLEDAHEHGVVHRDIKANNIMVNDRGHATLLDFGVALVGDRSRLTNKEHTIGTAAYMSPEQAQGKPVDHRTDVWSLGIVFFEMLAGRLPFTGDRDLAVMYSIVNEKTPPLRAFRNDVPEGVARLVARALAKNPEERYGSIAEFSADLERLRRANGNGGEQGAPLADMPTRALGERPSVAPSSGNVNGGPKTGVKKKRRGGPVSAFHQPVPERRKRLAVWLGICAVFLAAAAVARWRIAGTGGDAKPALPETKHVAVLPFETVGGDAATLALSDGLVETLTSKLTQLEQFQGTLMVVPSSEIRNEKISSVEQARRMFNLNLVITGSVQRWGERIQLTANLVDALQVRQLGATTLDVDVDDMASLREGFVGRVAGLLELEMTPAARESLVVAETNRPTAYRAYLEGRGYLQRFDVAGNTDLAVARFKEAVAQDPAYALAYAGLGEAYWKKAEATYDPHWSALAIENGEHAVELDENLPMTRVKLGSIYGGSGRHEDAIAEFQKALSLNPSNAEAYRGLGQVYAAAGRNEEAESAYKKSVELRPTDWYGYFLLARFYAGRGRFADAETVYKQAIEISPDNDANYRNLAAVYGRIGREAEAVKLLETALRIQPSALTYSYLGVEHYYAGEFQNAARNFEMAVDINSNDYLLWGNLADAYKWIPGEQRKAEQAFRRAIELGEQKLAITPDDELLRSLLAEYWVKLGESEKGLAIVRELGDLSKRSIHCRFHVATVLELTNQREKAVPEMIKLLDAGYTVRRIGEDPYLAALWRDPRIRNAAARLGGAGPAPHRQ